MFTKFVSLLGFEASQEDLSNWMRVSMTFFRSLLKSCKVPEGASLTKQMQMQMHVRTFVDSLDLVEARLVSIFIPFSQIRELMYEGQYGLCGA